MDDEYTKLQGQLADEVVILEDTDEARSLNENGSYGSITPDKKIQLSLLEATYLMEKEKLEVKEKKKVTLKQLQKKASQLDESFHVKYAVFRDFRERGYVIKTALKFGADFRVYDRGVKPGQDHARWVVFPVHENRALTWQDFAAKNRVAHSTKKRLMVAIVDDEGDVTYYEVRWVRP